MLLCPNHRCELIDGKPYRGKRQFVCPEETCDVACWEGSTSTPADQRTRTLRSRCHAAFDPLWKKGWTFKTRKEAYTWLGGMMRLKKDQMHFGMFSADQCELALAFIDKLKATV